MSTNQPPRLLRRLALPSAFAVFVAGSLLFDLPAGIRAGRNFLSFGREMIAIVPAAFILIGLFDAWIPQEKIERHLGHEAGFASHFWSMLLAGSTVGVLMVAFPVALPLLIAMAEILGRVLDRRGFEMRSPSAT